MDNDWNVSVGVTFVSVFLFIIIFVFGVVHPVCLFKRTPCQRMNAGVKIQTETLASVGRPNDTVSAQYHPWFSTIPPTERPVFFFFN